MIAQQADLFGAPVPLSSGSVAQLPLPLGWHRRAATPERPFLVGESNRAAAAYLDAPASWPLPVALLVGPRGSGRSTLARRFVAATGGSVIDDADQHDEHLLFHAWNLALASGKPLLLVAAQDVADWTITLADLATRLAAVPTVTIAAPDLALMAGLVDLGLAEHGVASAPDIGRFVAERLERSYVAVHAAVAALSGGLTARDERPTRANVRAILAEAGLLAEPPAAPGA